MHVQTIEQASLGYMPVVIEQLLVMCRGSGLLPQPGGAWVARRAVQPNPLLCQRKTQPLPPQLEELMGFMKVGEHRRGQLNLAAEHFLHKILAQRFAATPDYRRRWCCRDLSRAQPYQQVFFLDAECAGPGHIASAMTGYGERHGGDPFDLLIARLGQLLAKHVRVDLPVHPGPLWPCEAQADGFEQRIAAIDNATPV